MRNTHWKDVAELLGIAAIVVSLIFVVLELQQSQKIAIAEQYQTRTAFNLEFFASITHDQELRFFGDQFKKTVAASEHSDEIKSLVAESDSIQLGRNIRIWTRLFLVFDNNQYHYEQGLVDNESWRAMRRRFKSVFAQNALMQIHIANGLDNWRPSVQIEINEMIQELSRD